jgi:hypothetical protein
LTKAARHIGAAANNFRGLRTGLPHLISVQRIIMLG